MFLSSSEQTPFTNLFPLRCPTLLLGCFCASTGRHIQAWESVCVCLQRCVSAACSAGSNEGHVWEASDIVLRVGGVPHSPECSLLALLTISWLLPKLHKDVAAVLYLFHSHVSSQKP